MLKGNLKEEGEGEGDGEEEGDGDGDGDDDTEEKEQKNVHGIADRETRELDQDKGHSLVANEVILSLKQNPKSSESLLLYQSLVETN